MYNKIGNQGYYCYQRSADYVVVCQKVVIIGDIVYMVEFFTFQISSATITVI